MCPSEDDEEEEFPVELTPPYILCSEKHCIVGKYVGLRYVVLDLFSDFGIQINSYRAKDMHSFGALVSKSHCH